MAEGGGDKSEEPTPHRLREAREKGQIAKSKEITTAVLLLLSYFLFRYLGDFMWRNLIDSIRREMVSRGHIEDYEMDFLTLVPDGEAAFPVIMNAYEKFKLRKAAGLTAS